MWSYTFSRGAQQHSRMVFVLNKGMVHIQYLKVDQAVEKKNHSEAWRYTRNYFLWFPLLWSHPWFIRYTVLLMQSAFCIALCFKIDYSNANNLQMEKKKSKALDNFYVPNSGSGVVLEMYFSCDEWLAVDLLVPLQIWVHATKVWHRRRCKVQRNNAHQTRVHSGKNGN